MMNPLVDIIGKRRINDKSEEYINSTSKLRQSTDLTDLTRSTSNNQNQTSNNQTKIEKGNTESKSKIKVPLPTDFSVKCVELPNCPDFMKCSVQQKFVLYCILYGRLNVLLSGAGGCGKSFILKTLHQIAKQLNLTIFFCGTTGRAATVLPDGMTLHSFLNVGLAKGAPTKVGQRIARRTEAKERISKCDILVIDEVSMLDVRLLECLNVACKIVKRNQRPFGGMQVVLSGDFYQLPPVKTADDFDINSMSNNFNKFNKFKPKFDDEEERLELSFYKKYDFCFEHEEWSSQLIDVSVELTVPFRQDKDDEVFLKLLGHIREGEMTEDDHKLLEEICKKTVKEKEENKSFSSTIPKLFAFNANVDEINNQELDKLDPTKSLRKHFKYKTKRIGQDENNIEEFGAWMTQQLKECMAYSTISLCTNSLVMLVVNTCTEEGFVNGLDGVVTGFDKKTGLPIVKFSNGVEKVVENYSWKHVDSRFDTGNGGGENTDSLADLAPLGVSTKLPQITYDQIPLKLAHAITIHKSQGSTLCRAQTELPRSLQCGQGYVAISRLRSLSGLYLTRYERGSIKAHSKAKAFYKNLREANKNLVEQIEQIIQLDNCKKSENNQISQISQKETDKDTQSANDCFKALTTTVQFLVKLKLQKTNNLLKHFL